ncbi:class II aldolase/adducin family protein [Mesoplasma seiffertii]|uniref:class II aldolase/adducin family protein n=1 Tax=Mesoplasma seiffertii TaxID=28224 RepID=UPI00047C12C7|nr:class II aldolase/adducin family protein [Mesoplasma seiffertii]
MRLNNIIIKSTPLYYFFDCVDYLAKKLWLEGNTGSVTAILDYEDIYPYFEDHYNSKEYKLGYEVPNLSDQYILVTGNNIPLRNLQKFKFKIHKMIGIIRINYKGDGYKILWGFKDNEVEPTRYLELHLKAHNHAISKNEMHRIVTHAHPTNLIMKTMTDHMNDEKVLSYDFWDAMPHIMEFMPQGVGLVDKYFSKESWDSVAEQFLTKDLIVLKHHGLMAAAKDFDEIIGVYEIIDKAANISMKVRKEPWAYTPEFLAERAKNSNWDISPEILAVGHQPKPKE